MYLTMTDGMRDARSRYFSNARELRVQFSDLELVFANDEALATFTRIDDFTDGDSGRAVHLKVRVNSVIAKQGDTWKIKLLKKSS